MTSEDDEVAIVSRLETWHLLLADRKPFFYLTPTMQAGLLSMKEYAGTFFFTKTRLNRTITQLDAKRPQFVFIEQNLYNYEIKKREGLVEDLPISIFKDYLLQHYQPYQKGEYLIALKRK